MNENGSKKNIYIVAGLGVVGILLLVALAGSAGSNREEAKETSQKMPTQEKMTESTKMPESTSSDEKMDAGTEGDVKYFTLDAGSFYYKPNVVKVKMGDKVKITINSKDMMHNINIDEFNAKSGDARSGESASIEFVASKKGTFEFYCSVGQHRAKGQVGSLIVE